MGHETSDATREKMRIAKKGKFVNEKNPNWRGDDVSYEQLHLWIKDHKPKPLLCELCGEKKKLELANISGEYKRDVKDFLWVCRSCNQKMHVPAHPRFKNQQR